MNKKLVVLTILLSSVFFDDLTYAEDNSSNPTAFDRFIEGAATKLGEKMVENMINNAGAFSLTNECSHSLKIALRYYNVKSGDWDISYWNIPPNNSTYLDAHGSRVKDVSHYYAETSDGSDIRWKGNYNYGGHPMKELSTSQLSEKEIRLAC